MVKIKGFSDIKAEKVKEAAKKVAVSAKLRTTLSHVLTKDRVPTLLVNSSLPLSTATFERSVSEFLLVASSWMLV